MNKDKEEMDVKTIKTRIRDFQIDMQNIEILKSTEGYGYDYADLPSILKAITPILLKHKIWYQHETGYDKKANCNLIRTHIYCIDNELRYIECSTLIDKEAVLGGMNRFQVEGSAITYFRRYHIVTLLGLTTEEDTDAAGKRKTKQLQTNKSSTSKTEKSSELNFIDYFTKQVNSGKSKEKVEKVLSMYKEQINNEDLKTINNLIKEKYEQK